MKDMRQNIRDSFIIMKDDFNWSNPMEGIRIQKIVVTSALGRLKREKGRRAVIEDRLEKMTGQKPISRKAKKSIATFKLREGELISYMVTLRNENMYEFLNKLINISLPRMKDFQGISKDSVDAFGNLTIGIKEHTIFPEIQDENLNDIFSLAINLTTTAKNKQEGVAFFEAIGLPFRK